MPDQEEPDDAGRAAAVGRFVVIVQGAVPWAGVVEGVAGVKDALARLLWKDPERAVLDEVAAVFASLDDPATWATHGAGDGQPFWHWWSGFEGGSVTVQRLTQPLPAGGAAGHLRSTLAEVAGLLAACAADLRALSAPGTGRYQFRRKGFGGDAG